LIRHTKAYFKPLLGEISRAFYDVRSSYGNDPEDSLFGFDHQFLNLEVILSNNGILPLENKFKDTPAIIAATGPSLNKNIHLLPEIKDRAVFFGADASLNTFLKYEPKIIPHIICSLERNLTTKNHFAQIPQENKKYMNDIWLAGCPVVRPEVYQEWHGKHIVLFRDFAHFKWLGLDKGILNTGKSVTNMAFMLAHYMGCSPIILVGQDLAFAPDGETHVKGADHASNGLKASKLIIQRCQVEGNYVEQLDSLDTWIGMKRRFESDIAEHNVHCINATEGGAKIYGTELMALQDVYNKYLTKDHGISDKLKTLLKPLSNDKKEMDRAVVDKRVNEGLDYYKLCIDNIKIAIDCIHDFFGRLVEGTCSEGETVQMLEYADRIRTEITGHKMCYHSAMHVIQSWTLGRANVLCALQRMFDKDEIKIAKAIKLFEFFIGLEILYKKIDHNVRETYGKYREELQNMRNRINGEEHL
jgi:hypothetical protein